jgi:cell wall-associated NlpC family hydrolase
MDKTSLTFCRTLALLTGIFLLPGLAAPVSSQAASAIPLEAVTADFPERDRVPQSAVPPEAWYGNPALGSWGPKSAAYPPVAVPAGYDALAWKRARVAAVARRYVGLSYRHHHIPAYAPPGEGAGLDCSNFTSWVYNYALGLRFVSAIAAQADGRLAPGRRLAPNEPWKVGDLLFLTSRNGSGVSHVVLWLGDGQLIDSRKAGGVAVRPFAGRSREALSHVRRVIE